MSDPIDILGVAAERMHQINQRYNSALAMQSSPAAAVCLQLILAEASIAQKELQAVHDLIIDLRNSCL